MGQRASSTTAVFFEDVVVPEEVSTSACDGRVWSQHLTSLSDCPVFLSLLSPPPHLESHWRAGEGVLLCYGSF